MDNENDNKETMEKTVKKINKTNKSKDISITKFEDLEGKFLHIKVGNYDSPATSAQIEDIQKQIVSLFEKNNVNCLAFVTHHAVDMDIIEKDK